MPEEITLNLDELRQFVERQMKDRGMNPSQFAEFIGVSHTTIGRLIHPKEPTKTPSPDLYYKLASATKVDLGTIIAMVVPKLQHTPASPRSMERADRIEQLSPDDQNTVDELIAILLGKSK